MNGTGEGLADQTDAATIEELAAEVRHLRAEIHRMHSQLAVQATTAQALAQTEAHLAKVTAELAKARASSAYRIGQILIQGARRPARAPVVVPRELARLWKARRASPTPATLDSAAAFAPDETGDPTLLHVDLSAHLVTVRDRPVVAGVLARGTTCTVAQAAHLSLLRPNDALQIVERTRPDVLLVESAAGRWGPWAHLGSYGALERDRLMLALLERARDSGVPSVLWLDTPDREHPGLMAMSGRFDIVLRSDRATVDGGPWSAGVSLREFHPVGLPSPEHDVALPSGAPKAMLAFLAAPPAEPLRVIEAPDAHVHPERLANTYRSAAAYLAVPAADAPTHEADEVARALACGTHVVAVEPNLRTPWIGDDLGAYVHVVADNDSARAAVRAVVRGGRRDDVSARALLRTLRDHRSVQARLSALLDLVGRGPFPALAKPRVASLDSPDDTPWVAVDEPGNALLVADPFLLRDLAIIAECVDADVAAIGSVTEVTTAVAEGLLVFRRAALDAAAEVPNGFRLTEWARGGTRMVTLAVTRPLGGVEGGSW